MLLIGQACSNERGEITGFGIRGWSGASDTPISLALSSDGNTLNAVGVKNATVKNINYFISYAWI